MSDYLERIALRAAGLDPGRPAAAPDLPPVFGVDAERPTGAPGVAEMEVDAARPSPSERGARGAARIGAQHMQPDERSADPAATERQTTPTPAQAAPPLGADAAPRGAVDAPAPPIAAARAPAEPDRLPDPGRPRRPKETAPPVATADDGAFADAERMQAAPPAPTVAAAAARPAETPARKPEAGRAVAERSAADAPAAPRAIEPVALRPAIEPIRVVAEPPAPAPLAAPAVASGAVEVSVHVGRVVVRQDFAPPLPAPPLVERPRSAFTGQSLARRHVDRRWY